jgi:hypothetical protein
LHSQFTDTAKEDTEKDKGGKEDQDGNFEQTDTIASTNTVKESVKIEEEGRSTRLATPRRTSMIWGRCSLE